MARLYMIMTLALVSIFIPCILSLPSLPRRDLTPRSPRSDQDCFATTFPIVDFKSFSGSDNEPASVSFKTDAKDIDRELVCSRRAEDGATSPYFDTPVPCNGTTLPNIFFSYPAERQLRLTEVTKCGTENQFYLSFAQGDLPLFCYEIFGGQTCMTPTGHASLQVIEQRKVP